MCATFTIILAVLLLCIQLKFNYFTPPLAGWRVLMYHKLSENKADSLTVTAQNFEKQILYLLREGYTFYSVADILSAHESKTKIAEKAVTLTFDDAYLNNSVYLLPVLKKYGLKACVFIPVYYIGKENSWDEGHDKLMDAEELKKCIPFFEYGLHSYSHKNMSKMEVSDIETDTRLSISEMEKTGMPYIKTLAYPFGQYPRNAEKFEHTTTILSQAGIKMAFRIGNKINKWPLKNPYLIKRIDIQGTDTFYQFKTKVKKGRVKLF